MMQEELLEEREKRGMALNRSPYGPIVSKKSFYFLPFNKQQWKAFVFSKDALTEKCSSYNSEQGRILLPVVVKITSSRSSLLLPGAGDVCITWQLIFYCKRALTVSNSSTEDILFSLAANKWAERCMTVRIIGSHGALEWDQLSLQRCPTTKRASIPSVSIQCQPLSGHTQCCMQVNVCLSGPYICKGCSTICILAIIEQIQGNKRHLRMILPCNVCISKHNIYIRCDRRLQQSLTNGVLRIYVGWMLEKWNKLPGLTLMQHLINYGHKVSWQTGLTQIKEKLWVVSHACHK